MSEIENYNWCKYVLDVLVATPWDKSENIEKYISGHISFIMAINQLLILFVGDYKRYGTMMSLYKFFVILWYMKGFDALFISIKNYL